MVRQKRVKAPERKLSTAGLSLYQTLGIKKEASPEEVKRAYRTMALRYHPDKNPDDPNAQEKIRDVNFANQILSDVKKRELYDAYGSMGLSVAEQIGEDNVRLYFFAQGKCFKACMILCGIFTGCFCCFCCCCCCRPCRKATADTDKDAENQAPDNNDTFDAKFDANLADGEGTPRGFEHEQSSPRSDQPRM
ncbi:dnaJ homolog subfamily C member 5-like [Paramacrobiotus metropolitanus]|uniref:dnaJ homolog subfamily C member 5-like n=1 Tax=Paramacrobiotus metropolitanus TaxID=2943436 RepID=UPI002446225D|nr:dnaJ homolog subfamily C member 5-like [Paramacrobiotus metropolitanus]